MARDMLRTGLWIVLVACVGAGLAQEANPDTGPDADAATEADAAEPPPGNVENCFNTPSILDMTVMSDQHVYVRTRGGHHYLLTAERECKGLMRSDLHSRAALVPYGRRVCEHDGSYVLYESSPGREAVCQLVGLEQVDDRAQARSIAESGGVDVEVEGVVLPAE